MFQYVKPIVLISMCLGFKPVRFDGNVIYDSFIEVLKKYINPIPVCPEIGVGLGVPRNPLVLYEENGVLNLVDVVSGVSYTERMKLFFDSLKNRYYFDGVLLKSASPSCGVGDAKVYGPGRRVVRKTDGLFTRFVRESYPCIPLESEKRLYNYEIRVRFLTKLFTIADFRTTINNLVSREDLVDFHKRNKYIIMLHSNSGLKNLGRIIASRKSMSIEELIEKYSVEFMKTMCRNPGRGSYTNVFIHIYGHLKEEMELQERRYVLDLITRFKKGYENLRTIMMYFRGFIHRFRNKYLEESRFLNPYPDELDTFIHG